MVAVGRGHIKRIGCLAGKENESRSREIRGSAILQTPVAYAAGASVVGSVVGSVGVGVGFISSMFGGEGLILR